MITVLPGYGCGCGSSNTPKLIFSCSGSADVGELADRSARRMAREGIGSMSCLAGIGGRVSGLMKSTEAASGVLAIDGCILSCSLKTLEVAGFTNITHLCLADLNFKKGRTEVNDDSVGKVVKQAKKIL